MALLSGFANIRRTLSDPNYGWFTAGNFVSLVGTWMQRLAVGWLTWELTGSAVWLGLVAFADLFPTIILAPFAGATADRVDRLRLTRVTVAASSIHAVVLLALSLAGWLTAEMLVALTAILGVLAAFEQPARLSLIPGLVGPRELPTAIAINSLIFNMARLIGPALAGLVLLYWGIDAAFLLNAISFLVFFGALLHVRLHEPGLVRGPRQSIYRDMVGGLDYVLRHPGLAPMLLVLTVNALGTRPIMEMLPAFTGAIVASSSLTTTAAALAMLTCTLGAGAICGSVWLAQRSSGPDGLAGIAFGGSALAAVGLLLFVATEQAWLMVPAIAAIGTGIIFGGIGTQTAIQMRSDPRMRGRVLGLYAMIFKGGSAIGALLIGALAESAGLRLPLAVGAAATLLIAILGWRRRHRVAAALQPPAPSSAKDAAS